MNAVWLNSLIGALRRKIKAGHFTFEPVVWPGERQLLVDVSTIVCGDVRTGIQRVVRALLGQLIAECIPGVKIQPVYASRDHLYCKAVFQADGSVVNANLDSRRLEPVEVREGDIFLGLDLAAQILPALESELATWRRKGVSINIVVYDMLPLLQPQWFSRSLVRNFKRWFDFIARESDRCICISKTVADDLAGLLSKRGSGRSPAIEIIPLGANLEATFPSAGMPDNVIQLKDFIARNHVVLTVGTIEPRKGHASLLDAFDHIWQSDFDSNLALMIVGRCGWKTEVMQERIISHPEFGKRLMWIDQASDELLVQLYGSCAGLVSASYQEGFGLPLIEAAAHGAPILARDIPVFREVGGQLFSYFNSEEPFMFAAQIKEWLAQANVPSREERDAIPTWGGSVAVLKKVIGLSPEVKANVL